MWSRRASGVELGVQGELEESYVVIKKRRKDGRYSISVGIVEGDVQEEREESKEEFKKSCRSGRWCIISAGSGRRCLWNGKCVTEMLQECNDVINKPWKSGTISLRSGGGM